jgi:glyoxylase-like metal-dependent hydrolase (beta-lactamase superfamily II)/rhodanese-related sulfurtransferase
MLLKHYFVEKIAHSSYILAGQKSCAVIDPQRDIELYLREARQMGFQITHILQTHLHADFISGHMDLAKETGAKIYIAKSANCKFEHVPLVEDDTIAFENIDLRVLETPGHTPEHLSFVVTDKNRGESPIGVFVGDTLFVGDVGRPDLFPDMAKDLAGKLYHSLHDKLLKLPGYCEVYPAHGAGSLCGRSMGAKYLTTIGYERQYNPALQIEDKDEFIKSLTEDMPSAPDHFSRCSDINRQGPARVEELPRLARMSLVEFQERMEDADVILLDTRNYLAFGGQHIKGSWHLDLNGNFPTFAGWVLPIDQDILLIADSDQKAEEAVVWARRVGVDRIVGYLAGGLTGWLTSGLATGSVKQISAEKLHDMVLGDDDFTLIDVRAQAEFEENHIKGAINIETADLRTEFKGLDPHHRTILVCSSGNRSSLGTSILAQKGFTKLLNVSGGMTGYSAAGYAKECRVCANPHGSRYFSEIFEH